MLFFTKTRHIFPVIRCHNHSLSINLSWWIMPNELLYLYFTFLKSIVDAAVRLVWCMRKDGKYPVYTIIAFAQLFLCGGSEVTERTAAGGLIIPSHGNILFSIEQWNGGTIRFFFLWELHECNFSWTWKALDRCQNSAVKPRYSATTIRSNLWLYTEGSGISKLVRAFCFVGTEWGGRDFGEHYVRVIWRAVGDTDTGPCIVTRCCVSGGESGRSNTTALVSYILTQSGGSFCQRRNNPVIPFINFFCVIGLVRSMSEIT
jgi:hypothetical protein